MTLRMKRPMKPKTIAAALCAALVLLAGCSGDPHVPEASFSTLSGERLTTEQLRGKVVLVNFWATSCVSCVREMPKMVETYRKFASRGYETVAVAMSYDPPAQVADFARSRALPFKVAVDANGALARSFGDVRATPMSFLIDRQGRIVKRYLGEPDWADLHATVEKALRP